jgi:carnitine monooxygenase subunit
VDKLVDGALMASHLKITDPARIPAGRYYDPEFFEQEKEHLWPHVWQMAARLDQIPDVGDWTTYKIFDKSVIVVRTKAGVKAFHNACRHRGVQLANGHGNCKSQGFICPFHGWRWNAEGKNTFVYARNLFDEASLEQGDLDLPQVRTEEWGGCVFINFDDDAPGFKESIGPMAGRMEAHGANDVQAEWWFETVLPANWKIAMEAFMEGFHVMKTHPQLQQIHPTLYNSMYSQDTGGIGVPTNPNLSIEENIQANIDHLERLGAGMAGMVHDKEVEIVKTLPKVPLPEDPEQAMMHWYGLANAEVTRRLRERGENVPDLNAVAVSDPVHAVEFFFPHYFLLPMFTSMSAYRIRPLTPETCVFELWSLTHKAPGDTWQSPREPTILPYNSEEFPEIPRQDYSNIPEQQLGLHAKGFEFMRLSSKVEGLLSNYQRIIDGYIAGVEPDKLKAATNELGGNFDGPIKDLGF